MKRFLNSYNIKKKNLTETCKFKRKEIGSKHTN